MEKKKNMIILKQGILNDLSGTNGFLSISRSGVLKLSKKSYMSKKEAKKAKIGIK